MMLAAGFTEDDIDGCSADLLLRRSASVWADAGGDVDRWTTARLSQASSRSLGQERRTP